AGGRRVGPARGGGPGCPSPAVHGARGAAAVTPTGVAVFYRHRRGDQPREPRPELGHAANFLYMLDGREPDADRVRYLQTYLVLLADHGLNASTFTARVVASTASDLWSAVVAAIGALKGPAPGGAAAAAMNLVGRAGGGEEKGRGGGGVGGRGGVGHRCSRKEGAVDGFRAPRLPNLRSPSQDPARPLQGGQPPVLRRGVEGGGGCSARARRASPRAAQRYERRLLLGWHPRCGRIPDRVLRLRLRRVADGRLDRARTPLHRQPRAHHP